ncbi:hypothetical protein Q428_06130 [Fervidicella metallireducens AeB]|uniref:Uncharacterized protein n=1 Tax=Fervidicella metallireducens AeB TaxID=1403537 RepID=A0A017RWP8_9CLOT|nr:hypothetical protein [Fervidicella metallireducens]EYE88834.1 hypothetical protein Q428_06130 [Fervidicella metallireducens AeB]
MPYFILITGIILIYVSSKLGRNKNDSINQSNKRQDYEEYINSAEIINKINEINSRMEEIENAVFVLNEKLNLIQWENKKKDNDVEDAEKENVIGEGTVENKIMDDSSVQTITERDKNALISELYNMGKDIDEICSLLNIGKGEALLRIGILKQKN